MSQSDIVLESVKQQLREFYQDLRLTAKTNEINKARIEGYMLAGVQVGLTSNEELKGLMINIHVEVFGKSIEQRRLEYALEYRSEEHWEIYDSPSFTRNSKSDS
ncbi:hypothetical protein HBA55_02195 [Pseudomaricurvus alkylphenolicus]|uniref:hypothetical protein n=1 Tax=Pseudomaricurvus alkylphenolicus TaxID=1306991 RepID=UPI001420E177|nr:hypothetical protein [Pseudomaricurvus alkylphenolicus]NIB38376.1 hypothetical protein [Pseudomaricurvus alkylphenolicus]